MNVNGWSASNHDLRAKIVQFGNLDIICLNETHLSQGEVIAVDGYKWYGNNRKIKKHSSNRTFGGVGILVHNDVFLNYSVAIRACDFDGLLTLEITHIDTGYVILISSTYLPPADSPYGAVVGEYFNRLLL